MQRKKKFFPLFSQGESGAVSGGGQRSQNPGFAHHSAASPVIMTSDSSLIQNGTGLAYMGKLDAIDTHRSQEEDTYEAHAGSWIHGRASTNQKHKTLNSDIKRDSAFN